MAITAFDKDTIIDFIPEYGGNRDSIDPCVVRLKFVPYSKVQVYARALAAKNKDVRDVSKLNENAQFIQRKQFIESVESISGYSIGGKEVTDPAEFYETADTDLIIEILRAMESASKLSEGQRKN